MKKQFLHILLIMLFLSINFACARKKVVVVDKRKDNGKHKGWYKNPNNPHHPASTKSRGNSTTVIINNSNSNSAKINKGNGNSSKPGKPKGNNGNGNSNGNSKGKSGKGNGKGNGKK